MKILQELANLNLGLIFRAWDQWVPNHSADQSGAGSLVVVLLVKLCLHSLLRLGQRDRPWHRCLSVSP